MRAVNLLPSDQLRVRKPVNRVALAGAASGAAVGMLSGALFMNARAEVKDQASVLSAAKAELASIPKPATRPSDDTQLVSERGARVTALTTALSGRVVWDRVLRQISSVLPEDVWLTRLAANAPVAIASPEASAAAAQTVSNGVQIEGYTYTQEGVALLLARLQVLADLRNVQLSTALLSQAGDSGQKTVKFTILADVARPGTSS